MAVPIPTPRSAATQTPPVLPTKVSGSFQYEPPPPPVSPFAAQALGQAQANILPAQQNLAAQQAASQAQTTAAQDSTQQAFAQLANILKGIGPAIGSGYRSAALDQGMLAKGFADGLAHIQSRAAGQTDAALGAGTPQAAQAAAALGGTGSQNAIYALGGYIPASTLNREGAAFQAAAAQLPGTAAGEGLQQVQALGAKQALTNAGFDTRQADLIARVPGLAQTALDHLNSQAATDQYHAATLKQGDARIAQGDQRLADTAQYHADTLAATQQYHQITVNQGQSRLAQGWTRTNHYLSDPSGNPVGGKIIPTAGYRLDANGTVVKDKTTSSKGIPGYGGLTASGVRSLSKDADKIANSNATLKPESSHYVGATAVAIPGTGHAIVPYDQTLSQVFLLGPHTRAWASKATNIVNTHYLPLAQQFASAAQTAGKTYGEAYAQGITQGILPPKILRSALKGAYVNSVGPFR